MASRWRIRHKLLLGLGLAVVLMALLMGGSLRSLWLYFLTINRIRSRLDEQIAAQEVRMKVADLTSDESLPTLVRSRLPFDKEKKVQAVRQALSRYEVQLLEGIEQNIDPALGPMEQGLLAELRLTLDQLGEAVMARRKASALMTVGDDSARAADLRYFKPLADDVQKLREEGLPDPPALALSRHADDLLQRIQGELTERLSDTRRHYQFALWVVVPSSIIGLLLLLGLMRSFYAWVLTPIRDLEQGVERVTAGDLSHRLSLTSGDEMEQLGRAFNEMLEQLEALYADLNKQVNERSRQLVRSERLASVGFLAAGVAHEINNPLASIAFCSEALEARLEELPQALRNPERAAEEQEVFHKYLKMIQNEAFRCKSITGRLLEFSRTGEPRRELTELRSLIQAVLDVIRHLPNHRGKHIVFEVAAGQPIAASVNPEELKSVVLNLVVNALESMDDGGRLTIRLGQRAGKVELRFTDTGCGMAPEVVENIFEPFFTRSRTGKGTGLGLTISHLIITQHGGEIEASSSGPGHGSTFTVRLPVQASESLPVPATTPPSVNRAA